MVALVRLGAVVPYASVANATAGPCPEKGDRCASGGSGVLSVVSESPRRRIRHEPGRMWLARPARPLVRPPQTDQPIADLTEVVWRRACSGSCLVRCSFPAVPGINNRQPMTPAGGAAS